MITNSDSLFFRITFPFYINFASCSANIDVKFSFLLETLPIRFGFVIRIVQLDFCLPNNPINSCTQSQATVDFTESYLQNDFKAKIQHALLYRTQIVPQIETVASHILCCRSIEALNRVCVRLNYLCIYVVYKLCNFISSFNGCFSFSSELSQTPKFANGNMISGLAITHLPSQNHTPHRHCVCLWKHRYSVPVPKTKSEK